MRVTGFRWLAVVLPTAAILLLDHVRHEVVSGATHSWQEELSLAIGVLLVVFVTSRVMFSLIERAQRREREAETLRRVTTEMSSNLELGALLSSVLGRGREILQADCAGVVLAGSPNREIAFQAGDSEAYRTIPAPEWTGFLWEAIDANRWTETRRDGPGCAGGPPAACSSCLAVPLRMGSQPLGAFCIGEHRASAYSEEERKLAGQMANLASVALSNALLHARATNLATLEERDRIAREMHDSLAQVLGFLSMRAGAARDHLRRGDLARIDAELSEMGQTADEAYLDVREAILGLRESAHASGRLVDSLERYLQSFSRQSGVESRLVVPAGPGLHLPPAAEIQLVRVVQEALTNVRKHARAENVLVELARDGSQALVTVEDDGRGFDHGEVDGPMGGYGLTTMQERLNLVGGRLTIESAPGRGTRVTAAIPVMSDGRSGNGKDQATPGG